MKLVLGIFILLAVFLGISYYISLRLYKGLNSFFKKTKFKYVIIIVSSFISLLFLGFAKSLFPLPNSFKNVLEVLSGYTMGLFLYLLLFTLAADFIFLLPRLLKLKFVKHRYFNGFVSLGVCVLTLVTYFYGLINAMIISHVSYDIKIQGKADISDIKLVLITDVHLGAVASEVRLQNLVDEINSLSPDLVCIAGDFFDTDFSSVSNPKKAVKILQEIKTNYGIYACLGNHDGGKSYKEMEDFLSDANINLLKDEYVVIDNRLVLVGRMDKTPIGGYGNQKRKNFSKIMTDVDESLPVIVLDHKPNNIRKYNDETDLILCGHTHKGQVFPVNLITDLMYDVDYGYYQKDKNSPQAIVSSGVGTWGMPMRVGSNNEIVSIRFICE